MRERILSFDRFVYWAFLAFITASISWCAHFASSINTSIVDLNTTIATLLERTAGQSEELKDHSKRIRHLETRFEKP